MDLENMLSFVSGLDEEDPEYPFHIEDVITQYPKEYFKEEIIESILYSEEFDDKTKFNSFYLRLYYLRNQEKKSAYVEFFKKHADKFHKFKYIKVFEGNCLRWNDPNPESLREAIRLFEEVSSKLPGHVGIKRNIASTILKYCSYGRYNESLIERALELIDDSLEAKPDFHRYHFTQAKLFNYLEDHQRALNSINKAIEFVKSEDEKLDYMAFRHHLENTLEFVSKQSAGIFPSTNKKTPLVFISYCWANPEVGAWVLNLCKNLRDYGIQYSIDKEEVRYGQDIHYFMERIKDPAYDNILVICDRHYKERADNREGGVGREAELLSTDLISSPMQKKVVPVVFEVDNNGKAYIPHYIGEARSYCDLSSQDVYKDNFKSLVNHIHAG